MKTIHLLRHAQTVATPGTYIGATDVPLSDIGRGAARTLAAVLSIPPDAVVWKSPLSRCCEMAEILFPGRDTVTEPLLRETDFGAWEGKTFDEIERGWPGLVGQWAARAPGFAFPEGERMADFDARIVRLGDRLRAHVGNMVVCVTHGGIIRHLAAHLVNLPSSAALLLSTDTASVTTIHLHDEGGMLARLNWTPDPGTWS